MSVCFLVYSATRANRFQARFLPWALLHMVVLFVKKIVENNASQKLCKKIFELLKCISQNNQCRTSTVNNQMFSLFQSSDMREQLQLQNKHLSRLPCPIANEELSVILNALSWCSVLSQRSPKKELLSHISNYSPGETDHYKLCLNQN